MNLNQFITNYDIRPADAIVMKKKFMSMVDHFVIYTGVKNGKHQFVANYTKGIKRITYSELDNFLVKLEPTRIDRFPGQEHNRVHAVKRAESRIGEKAYNFIGNNCEHFKNYVHRGVHKSEQVQAAGQGVLLGLAAVAVVGLIGTIVGEGKSYKA